MQSVKNKIEEYLNNKINLSDLNIYFRQNVPFSPNTAVENMRVYADMTVEGELSQSDIEDELISEQTLKEKLKKYLKKL